jgi:hypothetical protein
VARFDLDADQHLLRLHEDLRTERFQPGPYRVQVIRDPKLRLIAAPPVGDRVLHQALVAEIGPWYERSFIDHSYACGHGRGQHRAVLRYLGWTREYPLRLNLDIHRYFLSIHQPTLLRLLFRRLRDPQTRHLLEELFDAGATVYHQPEAIRALDLERNPIPPGSAIPIGSYLSQWAASLYLDGLDHFVKRQLKIRGYLRYMDDFALFGADRQVLEDARESIRAWLWTERSLRLNPKRWRVLPTTQPSIFLGYRVTRAGIQPSKRMRRRMRRRLDALRHGQAEAVRRSLESYRGWMTFG